jgi:hypothetical protein
MSHSKTVASALPVTSQESIEQLVAVYQTAIRLWRW